MISFEESRFPPSQPVAPEAQPALDPWSVPVKAWREGALVAIQAGSSLPALCARCGAGAVPPARNGTLRWHPRWIYLLLIVCNPLIYVLVAIPTTQRLPLQYYLCARHGKARARRPLVAAVMAVLGAGCLFAGCEQQSMSMVGVGLAWVMVAGVTAIRARRPPLHVREITGRVARLARAPSALVMALPPSPPVDAPIVPNPSSG